MGVRNGLRDGVSVNSSDTEGFTGLHWACASGHLSIVRILLACPDIEVNTGDSSGRTPLMWACCSSESSEEMVRALLHHPRLTSLNTRDMNGYTAIMWAVERGNCSAVQLLVHTPGVDMVTREGWGSYVVEMAR